MGQDERRNVDAATVEGFGREWEAFDQTGFSAEDLDRLALEYFWIFPFDALPPDAEGFDLGCGSGRWAAWVLPKVGTLHCIEPAPAAFAVAKRRVGDQPGARMHNVGVDDIPMADGSQDFGYSLGVLHHIPDTLAGLKACVAKLKPGAPFLVYLYYRFDNRPAWFRGVWRTSDVMRKGICKLPFGLRKGVTNVLATVVYWPLARTARVAEKMGAKVSSFPLSHYRDKSYYAMRTDALDRFGTRLEHRYTKAEIDEMMRTAGLENIRFSEREPFWTAVGYRAAD